MRGECGTHCVDLHAQYQDARKQCEILLKQGAAEPSELGICMFIAHSDAKSDRKFPLDLEREVGLDRETMELRRDNIRFILDQEFRMGSRFAFLWVQILV